jgi:hypothetical protein
LAAGQSGAGPGTRRRALCGAVGDEKALSRYRKTRLFTSGALTLDLLACYDPPLPFASQHVLGVGPVTLLVAENLATYTSFLTAARALAAATRPDLHIAWGIGGSFEQSVLSIPLLDPPPRYVRYFGDLDLAGLRIAARVARQAAKAGLPPVLPATGCYQFLLEGPGHWRRPDDSNRFGQPDYADACAWLPQALSPQAEELLASGETIAQEHLGLQNAPERANPDSRAGLMRAITAVAPRGVASRPSRCACR